MLAPQIPAEKAKAIGLVTALALGAAACLGLGLVLTQIGLRHLPPLRGACISVPSSALAYIALAPILLDASAFDSRGALLFVVSGCMFPAAVTLLTFEGNRRRKQAEPLRGRLDVFVAATREIHHNDRATSQLDTQFEGARHRMSGFDGWDDPFHARQQPERFHRLGVGNRLVVNTSGLLEPGVLGTHPRIIQTR